MELSREQLLAELSETRERANRLELSLRGAGLGTWDWHVPTGAACFNERWAEMLGYRLEEIEGHVDTFLDIVHPEDRVRIGKATQDHLNGLTESYSEEMRMRHRDGHWIWVHTAGRRSELDAEGNTIRVCGTHRDITRRKKAEFALRNNERRSRILLESTNVVAWEMNPVTYAFTYVTPQAVGLLGFPVEDWYKPGFWAERVHPEDREVVMEFCRASVGRGDHHEMDYRLLAKDGSVVWVRDVVSVTLGDGGRPQNMVGVMIDMTERKRAEEELRMTQAFLQEALEAATLILWAVDADGVFLVTQGSGLKKLGYEPNQAVGKSVFEIHDDYPDVCAAVSRCLAGEKLIFEVQHQEQFWESHLAPRLDSNGKIIGLVAVTFDVTERKRAETERRNVDKKLQEAQRLESLGVLAGGIAHDFNNLLVAIMGNAELALLEAPGEVEPQLEEITLAAERAADLARQMLAYSGRGRFVIETVDLSQLVEEMSHLMGAALVKGLDVVHELGRDLPPIEVDVTQVRQVVMNLITNASDSMPSHGGTIHIKTGLLDWPAQEALSVGELEPGEYVYLEVRDDGCGMSEDTRSRLFEPFFSTKAIGRGLGLAATLGIVRGHGGGVSVSSEPDMGTVIRVLLPTCRNLVEPSPQVGGVSAWRATGTILVVDDENPVRELAKSSLERFGWDVLTASDGLEALELFDQHRERISAVLLDQSMPRLNGAETLKRLRGLDPEVKVVISSGYDQEDVASQFAGDPAPFIGKPYRPQELARTIKDVIHPPFRELAHRPSV